MVCGVCRQGKDGGQKQVPGEGDYWQVNKESVRPVRTVDG